jgi:hypothetical protein
MTIRSSALIAAWKGTSSTPSSSARDRSTTASS